jgi:hypothetical protein
MSYRPATLSVVFNLVIDAPAAGSARLSLSGHLDDTAARQVLHVAADVVQGGCSRLVVDLDGLLTWDDEATYALVGCARLARWLPDGVAVVAAAAPGRELADRAGIAPDPDIMASCPAF